MMMLDVMLCMELPSGKWLLSFPCMFLRARTLIGRGNEMGWDGLGRVRLQWHLQSIASLHCLSFSLCEQYLLRLRESAHSYNESFRISFTIRALPSWEYYFKILIVWFVTTKYVHFIWSRKLIPYFFSSFIYLLLLLYYTCT